MNEIRKLLVPGKKNLAVIPVMLLFSCAHRDNSQKIMEKSTISPTSITGKTHTIDTATFGTGCFWCTDAIFQQREGVQKVTSGYSGGQVPNPTYKEVCTGTTGHAEVIQVEYDPMKISYDELLEAFWKAHDPTTLNRQGNDIGTQYRSVVFYHNDEQKQKAEAYKKKLNDEKAWDKPVVTE